MNKFFKILIFTFLLPSCLPGAYYDWLKNPTHFDGEEHRALILIEKIKESQAASTNVDSHIKVAIYQQQLEIELERLTDFVTHEYEVFNETFSQNNSERDPIKEKKLKEIKLKQDLIKEWNIFTKEFYY